MMAPPNPVFPGSPLEAPSKLSWNTLIGGGFHIAGGVWFLEILSLVESGWFNWICQLSQIACSCGFDGKSSLDHTLTERVSLRLLCNPVHIFSIDIDWSLNILLFLSFQIFHIKRPGMSCHSVFKSLLWYGSWLQVLRVPLISPCTLPSFWHPNVIFSHNFLPIWQVCMRCNAVSSSCLQLGHMDGPEKFLFLRLSQVKILLWDSIHKKVEIHSL